MIGVAGHSQAITYPGRDQGERSYELPGTGIPGAPPGECCPGDLGPIDVVVGDLEPVDLPGLDQVREWVDADADAFECFDDCQSVVDPHDNADVGELGPSPDADDLGEDRPGSELERDDISRRDAGPVLLVVHFLVTVVMR